MDLEDEEAEYFKGRCVENVGKEREVSEREAGVSMSSDGEADASSSSSISPSTFIFLEGCEGDVGVARLDSSLLVVVAVVWSAWSCCRFCWEDLVVVVSEDPWEKKERTVQVVRRAVMEESQKRVVKVRRESSR